MQWSDKGVVLSARRHGETSAIVQLLTQQHGRHAGLVRGGAGRKARGILQPGNEVAANWRARLEDQLGSFTVELERPRAAMVLDDPLRLAALTAAAELAEIALAEREPHPDAHAKLILLMDAIESDAEWPIAYVRWELEMLAEMGFGLDLLGQGAGATISTRTGRPVPVGQNPAAGERLLVLPSFVHGGPGSGLEVRDGLALTGFFLDRALDHSRRGLPARARLVERFARSDTTSGVNSLDGRESA